MVWRSTEPLACVLMRTNMPCVPAAVVVSQAPASDPGCVKGRCQNREKQYSHRHRTDVPNYPAFKMQQQIADAVRAFVRAPPHVAIAPVGSSILELIFHAAQLDA